MPHFSTVDIDNKVDAAAERQRAKSLKTLQGGLAALTAAVGIMTQFFTPNTEFTELKAKVTYLEKQLDDEKARNEKKDAKIEAMSQNIYQMARRARGVRAVRAEDIEE